MNIFLSLHRRVLSAFLHVPLLWFGGFFHNEIPRSLFLGEVFEGVGFVRETATAPRGVRTRLGVIEQVCKCICLCAHL